MKIMVIGGGGREHAIIKKLKTSPLCEKIYALPGNGGISTDAECVGISAEDVSGIVDFAVKNKIDFAVVAPDGALAAGTVDALNEKGIKCFGPDKKAAEIESSKVFAKELMKKYGIPTADYEVFSSPEAAVEYIKSRGKYPVVIKADGLALGKGVIIAKDEDEACLAVRSIMNDRIFGESGARIVVEEFLTGPEVSVLSFTDGKTLVPMVSSMDHKRAYDGDNGPNTGGMGTVAPNPLYTGEIQSYCMEKIFMPTVRAMSEMGRPFKGCLYFGLMLTGDGPKVIEYNSRFGDPETQVVLPLLQGDLLEIMMAVSDGTLDKCELSFSQKSAACVIIASGGYPGHYEKGKVISGIDKAEKSGAFVYHAGTALSEKGGFVTSGGRVLGVTYVGDTLEKAIDGAYNAAEKISFEGAFMRSDIGKRALGFEESEK